MHSSASLLAPGCHFRLGIVSFSENLTSPEANQPLWAHTHTHTASAHLGVLCCDVLFGARRGGVHA